MYFNSPLFVLDPSRKAESCVLYIEAAGMKLGCMRNSVKSKSATLLLSVGGSLQYFTTIRRPGNKSGNVSSLRA